MRFRIEHCKENIVVLWVLTWLQGVIMWLFLNCWCGKTIIAQRLLISLASSRLWRLLNPIGFCFTCNSFFDFGGFYQIVWLLNWEHWHFLRINRRILWNFFLSFNNNRIFDLFEFCKVLQIVILRLLVNLLFFLRFFLCELLILRDFHQLILSKKHFILFVLFDHLLLGLTSLHINRLEFLALFQLSLFLFDSILLSFLGQLNHEFFITFNLIGTILFKRLNLIEK